MSARDKQIYGRKKSKRERECGQANVMRRVVSLYVCVYVYVCVCVCVYLYLCPCPRLFLHAASETPSLLPRTCVHASMSRRKSFIWKTHVCVCTHKHIHMHSNVHACRQVCTDKLNIVVSQTSSSVKTNTYFHINIRICVYLYVYIYAYIYICIYMYIYIYVYI